jgi:hypothetical protein
LVSTGGALVSTGAALVVAGVAFAAIGAALVSVRAAFVSTAFVEILFVVAFPEAAGVETGEVAVASGTTAGVGEGAGFS